MRQQDHCSLPSFFEPHELEVASILVDLPLLIDQSNPPSSPFSWSCKRKRSSLSKMESSPSTAALFPPGSGDESKPKEGKAGSPTTPLSMLSEGEEEESGEKPPPLLQRTAVKKKSKEHLKEREAESEEQQKVLRREIENVTRYYRILEEENSKLRAIEQQLRNGKEHKRPGTETQFAQPSSGPVAVNGNGLGELQRPKVWVVAPPPPPCSSSCSSSGNGNNSNSGNGFDMNRTESGNVDGCFPAVEGRLEPILGDWWRRRYDDWGLRMATAAQARKRRLDKMRLRRGLKSRSSSKKHKLMA